MDISFHSDVCPRIIIRSFMSEGEIVSYNKSFSQMLSLAYPGTYNHNQKENLDTSFKSRMEFHFRHFKNHPEIQNMEKIWWQNFWQKELQQYFHECGGIFSYINLFNGGSLIGAFYEVQGLYQEHADEALVSAIFFHQDEKDFKGGELILTSSNAWTDEVGLPKKTVTVPYEKNSVVIFPSKYKHRVAPITEGERQSTQCFLYYSETEPNTRMAKMRLLSR